MIATQPAILDKLERVRQRGESQWEACCPAHEDGKPSLSISVKSDGTTLIKCHAGCSTADVMQAVGMHLKDLFPGATSFPKWENSNGRARIVATYDYRDEQSVLLFQAVRFEPKDFRQRAPKPGGGWNWSLKDVRRVPYRLPELLAADPAQPVFVVEGEKDCDRLASMGLVATCNPMGAEKWKPEFSRFLADRHVRIIADCDTPGRKHANSIAHSAYPVAASVRVINLPHRIIPDGGDVSDWLDIDPGSACASDVLTLADCAEDWTPPPEPPRDIDDVNPEDNGHHDIGGDVGPHLSRLSDIEARMIHWTWRFRIPAGRLTLIVGRPGEGKSFLTCDIASRISTGTPWPDGEACDRGDVLLITAEDDPADTIRPRLDAHRADCNRIHHMSVVRHADDDGKLREILFSLNHLDDLKTALRRIPDCRLVVIDPIGSFIGGKTDAHRDNEVRSVLAPLATVAEEFGVAIILVLHTRKAASQYADDSALGSRAFTGIARAVWHLSRDKDDKHRRLFLPGKCNLSAQPSGLAFTIAGDPPALHWEHDCIDLSADDRIQQDQQTRGPEAASRKEAADFLRQTLKSGPRPGKELTEEASEAYGISKRTLTRARKDVGVEAFRPEIPGPWFWRISNNATNNASHP